MKPQQTLERKKRLMNLTNRPTAIEGELGDEQTDERRESLAARPRGEETSNGKEKKNKL